MHLPKCSIYIVSPILLFLLCGVFSCSDDAVDPYGRHPLRISEMMVTGEYDLGKLEVEVHLFDAETGRFLGCSGQMQGLERVDSSDYVFTVDAEFHCAECGGRLFYEDIEDLEVEIWVIEDDEEPCPGPIVPGTDDIIGISDPIPGWEFDRMRNYSFENVLHLRMGS
ncbi:MAG: hypothetical protein KDH97_17565 [Calditrichaeota bacterium]|nr:hypothetical protein [Calditrichota bacterium]MCB0294354.1 hypothetical protein [Calditrichota bacterium]MCB0305884.1 hypothetical protein [Calditrichota bacterium]MCB0312050.1 hypothetical protein [Calditrichota bacterium]